MIKNYVYSLLTFLLFLPMHLGSTETLLPQKQKTEQPVFVKLLSEESSVQPGHSFWVGVELNVAQGWDTYWLNPGDSGLPTKVEWQLPEGFKTSTLLWPYPERFTSQSLVGFGYTHSVVLLAEITPPTDLKSGAPLEIGADVSWLACKEQCVPGKSHVSLNLPVKDETPEKNSEVATAFAEARHLLPQSLLPEEGNISVNAKEKEILLNFKLQVGSFGEIEEAQFFPRVAELIDNGAPQDLQKDKGSYVLHLKKAHPDQAESTNQLEGVLLLSQNGSVIKAIQIDEPFSQVTSSSTGSGINFSWALICAFLGGIILNAMPCVLPVIALKVFSFMKMANERRSTMLKHGGLFTLGVLASFWVLSILLIALRAYGMGIGWGFQLQEPIFVATLTFVLFLLALSLFGVFELGTSLISLGDRASSSSSPLKSSFLSGILATVVATPCTGPLLGPALGFAMTLPPLSALCIFTCMGLGMASPYLILSVFPKCVRFLPKPGNWMIHFKQFMGFIMMATCLWLAWVFGAQTDLLALFVLLASLLIVAIGAWIYGKWAMPLMRKKVRLLATVVAGALLFTAGASTFFATRSQNVAEQTLVQEDGKWQMYSAEKVQQLRGKNIPVFVDFTAKWCLICQANKVILHSSELEKLFEQKGVVTMTADWTKRDPEISQALEDLGRTGVPVYVLYPGDLAQKPYILPQTLTTSIVTDYLTKVTLQDSSADVAKQ